MGKKQENTKNKESEQRMVDLEKQIVDYDNQLKRAVADYHNLEKRVSEGRSELTSFMGAELVRRLLPVVDHLEQALSGISEQERQSGWVKGVELAVKEFEQVLAQEGLEQIAADPSTSLGTGSQFDPSLHEAVDTQEGDDNIILKVVRKGYNLNGKVLRPAQVVVGRRDFGKDSNPIANEPGTVTDWVQGDPNEGETC